jgi:hypothetical protein
MFHLFYKVSNGYYPNLQQYRVTQNTLKVIETEECHLCTFLCHHKNKKRDEVVILRQMVEGLGKGHMRKTVKSRL